VLMILGSRGAEGKAVEKSSYLKGKGIEQKKLGAIFRAGGGFL